jgi:hypothetical protein
MSMLKKSANKLRPQKNWEKRGSRLVSSRMWESSSCWNRKMGMLPGAWTLDSLICWLQAAADSHKSLATPEGECPILSNNTMALVACQLLLLWVLVIRILVDTLLTLKWEEEITHRISILWISTIKWWQELAHKRITITQISMDRKFKAIEPEFLIQFNMMIWLHLLMDQRPIAAALTVLHKEGETTLSHLLHNTPSINNRVWHSSNSVLTEIAALTMRLLWVAMWATTQGRSSKLPGAT